MADFNLPVVNPEPLPAIIANNVLRREDGTVWIVHAISNTGGIAMAWLQLNDAVNAMNELAQAIKEARAIPNLIIAKDIPKPVENGGKSS